jgi:GNAT superfamily N-acetyltransferase
MEIRPADADDREGIRAIARDSFQSSYSLSPQQIETLIEGAFADPALADRLDDPDAVVLVAESAPDGTDTVEVRGFVDVDDGAIRTIRWLHVDPEARGEGIATALIERVREEDAGRPLTARVLDDAVEGHEFLERFGLKRDGNDHVAVGGEEFAVAVFTSDGEEEAPNEPTVTVPESVTGDGVERTVDRDEPVPGREAPFFPVYSGEGHDDPYGYFCSGCGSTDVAADGLDRLKCGDCGNEHLADEWDSAYL